MAAACGYIVGVALGEEAIPKEWLSHLELKTILASQADKLLSLVQLCFCCYSLFTYSSRLTSLSGEE